MRWQFEILFSHTTAARSLLVIRADYKPGGPIIVHLPYNAYDIDSLLSS